MVLIALLSGAAVWARRRTGAFSASGNALQFEDSPAAEILTLDLRNSAPWSGRDDYVDAMDGSSHQTLGTRIRPFAIAVVAVTACGMIYERAGEWRDAARFPQIGRSVDIGGRSLNIFDSSEKFVGGFRFRQFAK